MLVRGLFAIVLVAALALHQRAMRPLRTLVMKPVALRVVGEVGGTISFMAALTHLPLANTSAIFQGASIIVSSGLYTFYREGVRERPVAVTTTGIPPDGL